jgi:integrase
MKGHKRFKAGAWRLVVDAGPDPITGRRRTVNRTVHAPNTKRGAQQADTELAKLVAEVTTGRTTPTSGITVRQLVERYVAARSPGWAPGQADAVRQRAENHIYPHLGDVPIERLRGADIEQLHATLRAKRTKRGEHALAESTIGRVHAILQAALAWAEDLELIPRNPAKRRKPKAGYREIKPPVPAHVARLLEAASDEVAGFLRLAALTGARRGQLCGLRWGDLELPEGAEGVIRWRRALAKVPGGVAVKETKTGARYATAIDPTTVDKLLQLRLRAVERALAAGVNLEDDGYVFARDIAGRTPWHPDGASQRFGALCADLGLEGVRLHDLRHYMATQMAGEGLDVVTIAGRGGWANATTPLRASMRSTTRPSWAGCDVASETSVSWDG